MARVDGIGCPTNAGWSDNGANKPDQTYTDPACSTGDSRDNHNQGLLLVKTGPEANYAAAQATLRNVKGITLHELTLELEHARRVTARQFGPLPWDCGGSPTRPRADGPPAPRAPSLGAASPGGRECHATQADTQ